MKGSDDREINERGRRTAVGGHSTPSNLKPLADCNKKPVNIVYNPLEELELEMSIKISGKCVSVQGPSRSFHLKAHMVRSTHRGWELMF